MGPVQPTGSAVPVVCVFVCPTMVARSVMNVHQASMDTQTALVSEV